MTPDNQTGPNGIEPLEKPLFLPVPNPTLPYPADFRPDEEPVDALSPSNFTEASRPESSIPPHLQEPEETVIREHRIASAEKVRFGGTNNMKLVHLEDDGMAIFKPASGEVNPSYKIERGSMYKRERAVYLISQLLDFDIVPPTVIRSIAGQEGSLQDFVENATTAYGVSQSALVEEPYRDAMMQMWLLDYIIYNSDRHPGNFMITENTVKAIDHGRTFADEYLYFYSTFNGEKLPENVLRKIKLFSEWEEAMPVLAELLIPLLPPDEATACLARIGSVVETVLQNECIPDDMRFGFTGLTKINQPVMEDAT